MACDLVSMHAVPFSLSQALPLSDICSTTQALLSRGILFGMSVPGILPSGFNFSHNFVISILLYSHCHESNCPWGCDRGGREWP